MAACRSGKIDLVDKSRIIPTVTNLREFSEFSDAELVLEVAGRAALGDDGRGSSRSAAAGGFDAQKSRFDKLARLHGLNSPVMAVEPEQTSNLTKVVTQLESKTICGQFVLLSPNASIVRGLKRNGWLGEGGI